MIDERLEPRLLRLAYIVNYNHENDLVNSSNKSLYFSNKIHFIDL